MTNLTSSAPHIHETCKFEDLADWMPQPDALEGASHSNGRLLHKGPDNMPESDIWDCTPGRWCVSVPREEFCHFVSGRAQYRADDGEVIDMIAGTCVLFPAGWTVETEVSETIRNTYMLC